MRIGKLVNQSGLSHDTIRFYERQGLISSEPEVGGSNNYRSYSEETVERLSIINKAQDAGFSIEDIKLLFGFLDGRDPNFDGQAFLSTKAAEVRRNIERAQQFLDMLDASLAALNKVSKP